VSANFRRFSRQHNLHPIAIDVLSGQDNSRAPVTVKNRLTARCRSNISGWLLFDVTRGTAVVVSSSYL
jgi:hypothetical protein